MSSPLDGAPIPARTAYTEQERQSLRLKRLRLAAAAYLLAVATAGLAAWMEFCGMDVLVTFVLIVVAINVAFYLAFVTGVNLRCADPSLTEWQIMAGICALMFMVYHAGAARGIGLLWVLLIFVFGVFRLQARQLWRLAALALLAYGLIIYLDLRYHAGQFDARLEMFQWLMLAAALAWFSFMGGYVSALRARTNKSEAFYRTMWETAQDAVLIVDAGGRIEYANPAVQAVFGEAPAALRGKALLPLVPARLREGRGSTFRDYLDSCRLPAGSWNQIETQFTHTNGHEFPAEVSAAGMQVEDREVFLLFVRDITARKQAEAALEAARSAAEASSLAKSQFMANMSHEVRTPMNGVLGMTEILLQDTLAPRQREYLENIRRASQSLMAVLDDVLDFSRVESGQLEIQRRVFDLELAVRDTARLFEAEAAAKSVQLTVTLAPGLPRHVRGDPARLRQILANLMDNAVKFTAQGRIEVRAAAAAPGKVRIEVIDTGVGIPAEAHARIFEAFTQADGSLTRRHGGSGLGLTLVRGLVNLMLGECGLDSTPGAGSRFWIELPLPAASAEEAAVARRAALPQYPGKRVLLVEDDALNARIASMMLAARGITVVHAGNGAIGAREYENRGERGLDLVLMDCQMPEMDGFESTRRIRDIERARGWPATPVAAFTAHAFSGYREQCLEAGMNDYISKPVTAPAFDALLGRWLAPGGSTSVVK